MLTSKIVPSKAQSIVIGSLFALSGKILQNRHSHDALTYKFFCHAADKLYFVVITGGQCKSHALLNRFLKILSPKQSAMLFPNAVRRNSSSHSISRGKGKIIPTLVNLLNSKFYALLSLKLTNTRIHNKLCADRLKVMPKPTQHKTKG